MRTRTLLIAASLLVQSMLLAQNQVSVMPVITPPYSIYLSDYQGALMVNLTNVTTDAIDLKLVGSLSGDNGYSAQTNNSYSPTSPIHLGPLETKVLYANSSELAFIDLNNLQVNAPQQIQDAVMQTGILPEGNYALCVQARDYYTNADLSPEAPVGCLFFNISNVQPPMLTFPWCNGTVDTEWPVFTWSPPIGNISPVNVLYDLYILELLPGQNTTDAMWLAIDGINGNPIVRRDLMVPSYAWQPYDPSLSANTTYAVAVVARDISNTARIENKGRSEVCTFSINPVTSGHGTLTPDLGPINPNVNEHLPIGPLKNTKINGRLVYQFKADAHQDCGKENIDGSGMPFPVTLITGVGVPGANTSAGGTAAGAGLSVQGGAPLAGSGSAAANMNLMPMGPFNFSGGTPANAAPPSVLGPSYSAVDLATLLGPPEFKWKDPFPVSPIGSKPMKNVSIRLVERMVLTNVEVSTGINQSVKVDRMIYGVDELPAGAQRVDGVDKNTWGPGRVVATGTTNENGEYSFIYNQTANTGVGVPEDPLSNGDVVVDILHGTNAGGVIQHNDVIWAEAGGVQRIYMIEVASPYYCSPDLEIYVQPNDDLELPEQVCYVRSYNLEVQASSGECFTQMGGTNSALGGVDVVVTRKPDRSPKTLPGNEGQDADELVNTAEGQVPLVSRCVTSTSNGKALFRNLVCHGNNTPDDYYLEFSTDKDRGLLNYKKKTLWYPGTTWDNVPVVGRWSNEPDLDSYIRNSDFKVETYPVALAMSPNYPRVLGRVMVGTAQPLANAQVKLELRYDKVSDASEKPMILESCSGGNRSADFTTMDLYRTTDQNGYFTFDDIPVKVTMDAGKFLGAHAQIKVTRYGYRPATRPLASPGNVNPSMDLLMGVQWDMTNGILMEPLGFVQGTVQDEDGKAIRCDVQVGDGPWGRTAPKQLAGGSTGARGNLSMNVILSGRLVEAFTVPAPVSKDPNSPYQNGHDIKVVPLSDQYFPLTVKNKLIYPNADGTPVDLGALTVKEKKHRVKVLLLEHVQRIDGVPMGTPVANATVRLGDEEAITDANGAALFSFRTPETEFRLKVTPSGNYRPVDSLVVNNVSPETVTMLVEMRRGASLVGAVVDEKGQPVANARVWVEMGADAYGPQLNQVNTAANGKFTLSGVPSTVYTVHAAKYDPAISYIGASQQVQPATAFNPLNAVTLVLKQEKDLDLTTLYGFPVEVATQVKNSDGTRTISGAFVQLPGNANFRLRDPAQRMPFVNVKVKAGPPNAQGVPKATPVSGPVTTDLLKMELKLYSDLDITLEGQGSFQQPSPMIRVAGTPDGGEVNGLVGTELSSFNFSYDFTGRFYLGDGPDHAFIKVFRSAAEYPQRQFNLMTRGTSRTWSPTAQWNFIPANATFSLRGFAARSDRTKSFVEPDVFRIATVLQVKDIPDITPEMLELNVGEVRVKKETIEGLSGGGDKLSFKLNNWSFESTTPWSFNSSIASIVIPKGSLKMADETGKLFATASVNQVLIRPNTLEMDVTNLGEVLLGGVAPVVPAPDAPWQFGYDAGYVFRGKTGAWRLGALTTGKRTVATIQGPAELVPSKLELSSFSMVSRGAPLAEMKARDYRYYNIMDMTPLGTFAATPDGVDMHMNCSMAIHGFPTVTGMFSFFKQDGNTVGRLKPLVATIKTGRGGVEYILDATTGAQVFTPGKFTSYGNCWMPPEKGQPGDPVQVRGFLSHTSTKTDIDVFLVDASAKYKGTNRQTIRIGGSDEKKMMVKSGKQNMAATQWEELSFVGNLVGMDNVKDEPANELAFVVKGAVKLDKGVLKMDSVSTPFGNLNMSYDFIKARLLGDLTLNKVDMGAVRVDTAQLNLLVDRDGFLISCLRAEVTIRSVPKPFDHHFPSFLLGGHNSIPPEIIVEMQKIYRLKTLPQHLVDHKILGVFLQNKMELLDYDLPKVNLLIFSVWGHVDCAVEAQVWVDFSQGVGLGLAGAAYADITAGFSVILIPCKLLVNVTASVGFDARYENDLFTFSGCAGVQASAEICEKKESTEFIVRLSVNSDGDTVFESSDEPCVGSATDDTKSTKEKVKEKNAAEENDPEGGQ